MSYGSQELYLRLLVEHHYRQVNGLVAQLVGYGGFGLFFTLDEPSYLPFFCVNLHGHGISVFDLGATLLAFGLVVYETGVFIVPDKLLAILGTIEPLNCLSPYPIHEGSITACPDLLDVVFRDLVSLDRVLGDEDVPCSSAIFTISVGDLVEFFVVGVGLVGNKPALRGNWHGKLQLLLFLPFLEVLESFENIGNSLVLSTQFLLTFLHLFLNLISLRLLFAYFLFQIAIFHLQSIDLLLQSLKLKCKDSLRVQFLFRSLNDTLIILNCISESSLNIEQNIAIPKLDIVGTIPQEVTEEIFGSAKEEINVFILLNGQ